MLKIAIVCGGGFSSSALAKHLENESKEKHLEDKASFIFIPILQLPARQDEVDIALVCPHSEWNVKQAAAKGEYHIPVSIIPPKLYGLMPADDFIDDAEDLYALWQQNHQNPVLFPDEPRPLAIKRDVSHRRHLKGEKRVY